MFKNHVKVDRLDGPLRRLLRRRRDGPNDVDAMIDDIAVAAVVDDVETCASETPFFVVVGDVACDQ